MSVLYVFSGDYLTQVVFV